MDDEPPNLRHYIGGRWTESLSSEFLTVPNPAGGRALARVPLGGPGDVGRAVEVARAAAEGWRETPVAERARRIGRVLEGLRSGEEELARGLTREHGKVLSDALGSVRRGIEATEFALSAPTLVQGASLPNVTPGVDSELVREPVGVVAGITPFNFPVMVPLWMAPLAIACGNTFILKPSERVPLSADALARRFHDAGLPPGVFNLVHGSAAAVDALVTHSGVDAVAFVGSASVARHVYATAAAHGKRVLALAGAKNHLIVMPDADLDRTVEAVLSSAFGSAGERCLAASVVVAVEPIGDPLVERLAEKVTSLRVGDGMTDGTEMGPVIRAEHRDRVLAWVRQGEEGGARLAARGSVPEGTTGFFVPPVLFDRVRPEMAIAQEEIFGPVLSVIRAATFDEAIAIANRSRFGNAAAIFTRDGRSAREFAHRIEAGMVGVNIGVPAPAAYFPFVGWKGSVFGDLAATGREAVAFYTRTKVITRRWY